MKVVEKLVQAQEEPARYEALKFVQERVDLYFSENTTNIMRADSEHNQTGRSLSSTLITYATVVIGLTSFMFSQDKTVVSLNGYQKGFLLAGLILLFLSILGGCLELWDSMQHFKKAASLYARANAEAPISTMEEVKDLHEFKNSLFKNTPSSSRSRGLLTQVSLLILGSTLYLVVFITVLFEKNKL